MKFNIAICDDEQFFIDEISSCVLKVAQAGNSDCTCIKCINGDELIKICEREPIDAVFLDIAMPGLNGFETARQLLKIRSSMILVFVSSKESMVFSSYEYRPFWFVPKSKMQLLEIVVEKVIKKIESDRNNADITHLPVKIENRIIEIDIKNVIYFKTEDHYITIASRNDKELHSYRDKLDNIETQLSLHGFIRVHNRYLVNCRMISVIEGSSCKLLSGEAIPISRANLAHAKAQYQAYLRSIR